MIEIKLVEQMAEMNNSSANVTLAEASSTSVGVENLYPALIECFGIIGLGYIAGR